MSEAVVFKAALLAPLARCVPRIMKLAKLEIHYRLNQKLSTEKREELVRLLLDKTDKYTALLPRATRRTHVVPAILDCNIVSRFNEGVQTDVDLQEVFDIVDAKRKRRFVLEMGDLLSVQGAHTHVYHATWRAEQVFEDRMDGTPAVVKTPTYANNTLWMLIEFIIHSTVSSNKSLKPFFSHLLACVEVPLDHWPHRKLFLVQTENPGVELHAKLEEGLSDKQIIAIMQQIAYAIFLAQEAYRFMHRDLKPENILITDENTVMPANMLLREQAAFRRSPILQCDGVNFGTFGYSVQLIDLGSSFIFPPGAAAPVSCDTSVASGEFNPHADLANLCLLMHTDFGAELQQNSPTFFEFLNVALAPILAIARANPELPLEEVSLLCKSSQFLPANFISSLNALQIRLTEGGLLNTVAQETLA